MICAACAGRDYFPNKTPEAPALQIKPTVFHPAQDTPTLTKTPTPALVLTPSTESPRLVTPITRCAAAGVIPIAFLPGDASLLVVSGSEIGILNFETGGEQVVISLAQPVLQAALSPDGQTLAVSLEDGNLQLIRLADKTVLYTWVGHTDRLTALRFTPPGDRLISASLDSWVKIWNLDGTLAASFQPGGGAANPLAVLGLGVAANGLTLGVVLAEGPLVLWDLSTNQKLSEYEGSISGGYDGSQVIFSADGEYLAETLGGGGQISLWRLRDQALLWRGGLFTAAFSPDSRYFIYTDVDEQGNNLIVFRSADGKEIVSQLKGHPGIVWKIMLSADGEKLASLDDSELRIWQAQAGHLLYRRTTNCLSLPLPTVSATP